MSTLDEFEEAVAQLHLYLLSRDFSLSNQLEVADRISRNGSFLEAAALRAYLLSIGCTERQSSRGGPVVHAAPLERKHGGSDAVVAAYKSVERRR